MAKIMKRTSKPLPRSVLAPLHEALLDPKDGHGARSTHDIMLLRQWDAAKKGDDDALLSLLKAVVRESLAELKAARGTKLCIMLGNPRLQMRSLVPAMAALGMIRVETVEVPPDYDGYARVTRRQKIAFEPWFADHALGRSDVEQETRDSVLEWLAKGGIQRPWRGDY